MSSDWRTASERLNRFASMDSNLGRKLADLSVLESNEAKLSMALESGRIWPAATEIRPHFAETVEQNVATRADRAHVVGRWGIVGPTDCNLTF